MLSKWSDKKEAAIILRKKGNSIRNIEARLNIPRSTLSGWFKGIYLTKKQKAILDRRWREGFLRARRKAALWHNDQKQKRLEVAEWQAREIISNSDIANPNLIEIAFAMLYLGEGFKGDYTGMANSDPAILHSFVSFLIKNCHVPINKIKCSLYLRADQKAVSLKKFWSQTLNLPIENFKYANIDQRTLKSKTRDSYKGVCSISCGNVAIQRRLVNIGRIFCEKISKRP